jgi:hypothetical protein
MKNPFPATIISTYINGNWCFSLPSAPYILNILYR